MRGSLSCDHGEEFVVDRYIYPKDEESLKKINLSDNIENFVDESFTHHVLDESPKSEVFDLDVNELDFHRVEKYFIKFPSC